MRSNKPPAPAQSQLRALPPRPAPRGVESHPLMIALRAEARSIVRDAVADALADVVPALERSVSGRAPDAGLRTSRELCQAFGMSRSKLAGLRRQGLPTIMLGDVPRFDPAAVRAWLAEQNAPQSA